jgi:hypothetical protein
MSQDKMTPNFAFGTTFEVEVLSREHWLSTWPITFQSGLAYGRVHDAYQACGRCISAVIGTRLRSSESLVTVGFREIVLQMP